MKWLILTMLVLASFNIDGDNHYSSNKTTQNVFNRLHVLEGNGDNLTGKATGMYGVTSSARKAVDKHGMLSDKEVSLLYLEVLKDRWGKVEGYNGSPDGLKEALLDLSYNIGESVFGYVGIRQCLSEGDYKGAAINTLDTANSGGKLVLGIAKRRAIYFNIYMGRDYIRKVVFNDNHISYMGEDGNIILKYKGDKHELSKSNFIDIMPIVHYGM